MTTASYPVELDRPQLEEDRYLVLLACGHWVHTRDPEILKWWCPVITPVMHNDGLQPAARTTDGKAAILVSWDLWDDGAA